MWWLVWFSLPVGIPSVMGNCSAAPSTYNNKKGLILQSCSQAAVLCVLHRYVVETQPITSTEILHFDACHLRNEGETQSADLS